jgi:Flp pilus assembly pilin Flp
MNIIKQLVIEEEGAEIAEYALLVVILALGLLTAAPGFQDALSNAFTKTGSKVSNNANGLT